MSSFDELRVGAGTNGSDDHDGRFGSPAFVVPAELRAAISQLAGIVADDVRGVDDDGLLGLFDGLESLDRYFHATRFGVLAELDARDVTVRRLGHVVPNEAGWRHGASPRRVRRDLTCAKALRRHLPAVADALARGEVSVDRARELALRVNDRNSAVLGGIQDALIALASAASTHRQFVLDVDQLCRLSDVDGAEPPTPRDHGSISQSGDCVHLEFDVYGAGAVSLAERLHLEADKLYRQAVEDHGLDTLVPVPSRSELLAMAFKSLAEHGAAHRHSGRHAPAGSFAIVIDASAEEAGDLFADGVLLPGPTNGAPIDWSKRARLTDGTQLRYASKEWELLTCDAEVSWTIRHAGGHPVACQAGERHASRQQRRNLEHRDGGCCFPGCDAPPSWCDAHHVRHHNDGGPTDITNLALLCRRHHGIVHRSGWRMESNPDPAEHEGFFTLATPTGAVLHSRHQRGPGWRHQVPA